MQYTTLQNNLVVANIPFYHFSFLHYNYKILLKKVNKKFKKFSQRRQVYRRLSRTRVYRGFGSVKFTCKVQLFLDFFPRVWYNIKIGSRRPPASHQGYPFIIPHSRLLCQGVNVKKIHYLAYFFALGLRPNFLLVLPFLARFAAVLSN